MSSGRRGGGGAPPLPLLDAEVLNSVAPIYSIINSKSIINIKVIKHYIKLSIKDTTKKKSLEQHWTGNIKLPLSAMWWVCYRHSRKEPQNLFLQCEITTV